MDDSKKFAGSLGSREVHREHGRHIEKLTNWVGMENRHFSAFFAGPYFRIIPPIQRVLDEEKETKAVEDILTNKIDHTEEEDYLGALKRIILNKLDVDNVYGLTNLELVPLPFTPHRAWQYLLDFLLALYQVAQSTTVMFIAILIDNDERGLMLGGNYNKRILPIIKALIILYPLVTLVVMTLLHSEYLHRKFMYYRLLSMRILVDWENKKLTRTVFFWYFIGTWILLNTWSLYGVIRFWQLGIGNRSGLDTVPFATFIVVNLQTLQLLLNYIRLLKSESRLVSLNSVFERAPVEAQWLLTYTYVIEEKVLAEECLAFGHLTVASLQKRLVNLLTCGIACKDWATSVPTAKFDLDRLKRRADNYAEVEEKVAKLRKELIEKALLDGTPLPPGLEKQLAEIEAEKAAAAAALAAGTAEGTDPDGRTWRRNPLSESGTGPVKPPVPPSATAIDMPPDITGADTPNYKNTLDRKSGSSSSSSGDDKDESRNATLPSSPAEAPAAPAPAASPVTPPRPPVVAIEAAPAPEPAADAAVAADAGTDAAGVTAGGTREVARGGRVRAQHPVDDYQGNMFEQTEMRFIQWLYGQFYATIHGFFTSVLVHFPTWPFRGDVPYFRYLFVLETIGLCSVAALVVFGLLRATSSNTCSKLNRTCSQCYTAANTYQGTCEIDYSIVQVAKAAVKRLFS